MFVGDNNTLCMNVLHYNIDLRFALMTWCTFVCVGTRAHTHYNAYNY